MPTQFIQNPFQNYQHLLKSLKNKVPTYTGYKLHKRITFQGMQISIENQKGSVRKWEDRNGNCGETKMKFDYGYIRNTKGKDGDHIDCYVGNNLESEIVFVVHQKINGKHDEDKVMLGFDTGKAAKEAYLAHYSNASFFGGMDAMMIEDFKSKVLGQKIDRIS
jgi:hypothetical protein